MKRYTAYSLFFFLTLLLGIAVVSIADADPEVNPPPDAVDPIVDRAKELLRVLLHHKINSLAFELHELEASLAKAETDKAAETASLDSLTFRIANILLDIDAAYEGLMTAANDAEREDWSALIAVLQKRLAVVEDDYYWTDYTLYMLDLEIDSLNSQIDSVEARLAVARARLAQLDD